ncbi:MAG: endopeptidase La [Calditrichaceae bacterium]|nr:endopeptidase La [Calditrichia bacterium]NUQ40190.1 endopeptidase La [Calditrichaceae bacterium]
MKTIQQFTKGDETIRIPGTLPLLPIRDLVIFPYSVVPLLVGREKSLAAIEIAKHNDNLLLVATQKNPEKEDITSADLFRVGTVCRVLQVLEFPNGHAKLVVEGITRARINRFLKNRQSFHAQISLFREQETFTRVSEAYLKQLIYYFQEYISFTPDLPDEMLEHLHRQGDPERMIDFVALNIQAEAAEKQKILQERDLEKRLLLLLELLQQVIGHHRVRQEIDQRVQERLIQNQRNYYLQEKLKVINKELGEEEELSPEILKLEEEILAASLPDHAREKAVEELGKLKKIPPFSPEYTVIRNYLDWLIRVPWAQHTPDRLDIREAQRILDEDHFGLEKPKERIVEHLAVLKRVQGMKGPILCFVGPPGVGKTSLGKSIARALGRNFVRISLGGVRDEAEIRGHRRTYIGSLPGKIIQSMKKAATNNPVFLLDEVDKMSMDFRGDPSAALLEVLDPEQNKSFVDHYLDVDYDLSQVFFITTANVRANIPLPLQDRMEIIELPGYLEHEKLKIAQLHLIPKQFREHGLSSGELQISEESILRIIREFTREAGVRNLEREIANLCRKAVRRLSENGDIKRLNITPESLEEFLGQPHFLNRKADLREEVGVATGLAWTPFGTGDLLRIEVSVLPGKGQFTLTGKLGEVMQESARTALSYIRSIAGELEIANEIFEKNDLHIHVPEGAVPKDGPSAGIALTSAIISALTKRPLRNTVAMTGEITLRGKVLAVGGLKEKLLAAQRNRVPMVIVPAENTKDIADLPKELREGLEIVQVEHYREVLGRVLV